MEKRIQFIKHLGYPDISPSYFCNVIRLGTYNHAIEFSSKTSGIQFYSTDFKLTTHSLHLTTPKLNINTCNTLKITSSQALHIACDTIIIESDQATIHITEDSIQISSASLSLSTSEVLQDTLISCVGDQHNCPASTASVPHIGGIITEGSPNVFIKGKAVARHNDLCLCHQASNRIYSTLKSITVNNKPIAYQLANTQHGGKVTSGQRHAQLKACSINASSHHTTSSQQLNQLQVEVRPFYGQHIESKKITIHFNNEARQDSTNQGVSCINQVPPSDLFLAFQVCLT